MHKFYQRLMSSSGLKLKGNQQKTLIQKFKERQEQTSLEEALVYLKLKEFNCDHRQALIFSKKKEKCIDGTRNKDGPAGFRKLSVLKPESKLVNGWLRGQKNKYEGTSGFSDFLKKQESSQKKMITSYNQKERHAEEEMRKTRSKSTLTIDLGRTRESIEKIGAIKEDASKERQNRNMYVEYSGVRLDQTTKSFFKEAENLDEEGLVLKLGAFDHIIADKALSINVDLGNMKGKSLTIAEITGTKKRDNIIAYQESMSNHSQQRSGSLGAKDNENWKRLIHRKPNEGKQLHFRKQSLQEASNPLILMNSEKLKKELNFNQEKCGAIINQYSNFCKTLDKAMQLQFLSKRQFSRTALAFPTKGSLKLLKPGDL